MSDITTDEFMALLSDRGVSMKKQRFHQGPLKAMKLDGAARQAGRIWLIRGDAIDKWLDYIVWFNQQHEAGLKPRGRGYKYDISEFVTKL